MGDADAAGLVEIDLDDDHDRRRWRCPRGHMSWEPTNEHFYCAQCSRAWDVDGEFAELVNDVTREAVPRDRIRLLTEVGHYKSLTSHREQSQSA